MIWNVIVKHIKLIMIIIIIMPSDVRKVFEHLNKENCQFYISCSDDGMDHNDQVVQTT